MQIKTDPKHLGFLVKTQLAIEKIRVATQVRNTHLHFQNQNDAICEELQEMLKGVEDFVDKSVAEIMETHPAAPWFSQVKGIGYENIAKVIGLVRIKPDPENPQKKYAKTISSLWKFAGMHTENGKAPRVVRGKKLEFNKQLRSMVWRIGRSLCRARGPYYEYYLKQKAQYRAKFLERGFKIIPSEKLPYKLRGSRKVHYESDGVISIGHLDNLAKRKMAKLFLSHLWLVWREAEGLSITSLWVIAHGGHAHLIEPWEMVAAKKSSKQDSKVKSQKK